MVESSAAGSIPLVGSSSARSSGSAASARAMSVRCRWPAGEVAVGVLEEVLDVDPSHGAVDRLAIGGAGRRAAAPSSGTRP